MTQVHTLEGLEIRLIIKEEEIWKIDFRATAPHCLNNRLIFPIFIPYRLLSGI
jgi:hypothetical protein